MNFRLWLLWRGFSVTIHIIAVSLYGFSLVFQFVYPNGYYPKQSSTDPKHNASIDVNSTTIDYTFGWKYKFLTFWNLHIQFIVFLIYLFCDCFRVNYMPSKAIERSIKKRLMQTRDTLHHSLVFPIGWLVSTMYWTLYFIDKSLVVNSTGRYPWWLTHLDHSIIVVIIMLETVITYHRRNKLAVEMSLLMAIMSSYVGWVCYLGFYRQIWVYGIFRNRSTVYRVVIFVASGAYLLTLYFAGLLIHRLCWPKSRREEWPQQWSADEISNDQLEFENFRVRQGLIT
ncbi:androgen-dependent TFPI-regulating protein-like [Oppia nitens]|uniref:androgen-dependent TFPI-regulating protein-like n=1 Tax=Oppia nitens TaxID=1686743 RepID=UPI0023DA2029|nr:androgen-dependent TFPI-regulating protein-like [Oppia nitens]